YARVGLGSIADARGRRFIEDSGGSVIRRKTVRSLLFDGDVVGGAQLSDGTTLLADAYVSALPYGTLLDLLPPKLASDPFFEQISGITSAPIVNVHLWYDRPVMKDAFIAFLESPIQWVFNRSLIQGNLNSSGQYVCISLSGAWDFINRPKRDLEEMFEEEMRRVFPLARDAIVQKRLIIKQLNATFRCVPGIASRRPSQVTPIENLFLAGDWTRTDWPSTMEGAVRSGVYAAHALSERLSPAKSR
ncbi:MAG: phytoene dehydrogenase, partial [Dehalococcoidia bacterium]|nr:phytoene dehydrogenase [Dehalococcoidia bacterium]